jgi:hypothetical protein
MARCSRQECRKWRPDALIRCAKLGLWIDRRWFCSDTCVEAAAARRLRNVPRREVSWPWPRLPLGAVLVRQGTITTRQLRDALESQRQSGLRLGAELQRLGYVDAETVLRALSTQAGVSYLSTIDPSSVKSAPGGLSADEVRALGIVPFRAVYENTLLVACTAPLPRAALGALEALIGCTVEPYLVADEDLSRLTDAYGAGAARPIEVARVRDIAEGAGRIAAVAAAEHSVTVAEAHVDPFTWVRIAANGRISALLVPPSQEDLPCLAATTRH